MNSKVKIANSPVTNLAAIVSYLQNILFNKEDLVLSMSSALHKGTRDYQEDAILTGTVKSTESNICVLADGMGGHSEGRVASVLVSRFVFDKLLKALASDLDTQKIKDLLLECTHQANAELAKHAEEKTLFDGMGTTLVAAVIKDQKLYWVSVGDSPMYLFSKGRLIQLNEDHSMAPQIDELVEMGLITKEKAKSHPNRNCLVSALMGKEINRINLPESPISLQPKDILIISSDGLQFLPESNIAEGIKSKAQSQASEITDTLMNMVLALSHSDQDNIGICTARYQKVGE